MENTRDANCKETMTGAFDIGYSLARHMLENNPPRTVGNQKNIAVYGELAEMVSQAGDGDYLEIGVFNGTSAIVAAKVKQAMGLGGRVVGLDDFDWYNEKRNVDEAQKQRALAYFQEYGVADAIDLILGTTLAMPHELTERRFSSAFIDGNHWKDYPYHDFLLVAPLVTDWIMFDDDDLPDVESAVNKIEAQHPEWQIAQHKNGCVLIRKVE